MSVLECPKPRVDDVAVPERYVIEDHIAVEAPTPWNRTLDLSKRPTPSLFRGPVCRSRWPAASRGRTSPDIC